MNSDTALLVIDMQADNFEVQDLNKEIIYDGIHEVL
jgi:hypothetical protein